MRPESRTLACVRTHAVAPAASHASARAVTHAQACTTRTLVRTVSQASGHMRCRCQSRMHADLRGRPPAAHAARNSRSCVCADASVAARAASHVNALTATHEQTRAARVLARDVSRACGHIRRRSQGRTPCDTDSHRQGTRPQMNAGALTCAPWRTDVTVASRAASHANALTAYARRRARTCAPHTLARDVFRAC